MEWTIDVIKVLRWAFGIAGGSLLVYYRKKITLESFFLWVKNAWSISSTLKSILNRVTILENTNTAAMNVDRHPIFIVDNNQNLIYANTALAVLIGFTDVRDAYGQGYMVAIPDEDIEKVDRLNKRMKEHESSYSGEFIFCHVQTKEPIITNCRSEIIRNIDGKLEKTLGRLYVVDFVNKKS